MYNPFDLIPHTIDKNLRDIIIYLIIIQFTAFCIFMTYLIYEFISYKRDPVGYRLRKEREERELKEFMEQREKKETQNNPQNENKEENKLLDEPVIEDSNLKNSINSSDKLKEE